MATNGQQKKQTKNPQKILTSGNQQQQTTDETVARIMESLANINSTLRDLVSLVKPQLDSEKLLAGHPRRVRN